MYNSLYESYKKKYLDQSGGAPKDSAINLAFRGVEENKKNIATLDAKIQSLNITVTNLGQMSSNADKSLLQKISSLEKALKTKEQELKKYANIVSDIVMSELDSRIAALENKAQ